MANATAEQPCCSPDVGDCRKCHPEMWKKCKDCYISKQFPKETAPLKKKKINKTRKKKTVR